jgi:hypothetical protein
MGEMPKFVKNIVAGASGTKPYIYQVRLNDYHCFMIVITDIYPFSTRPR